MCTTLFHRPHEFLDDVEAVARAGAKALIRYWRRLDDRQVEEKARNDLVSAADHASEDAILAEIERRYPGHGILSEESGWKSRPSSAPYWIVDPLDGTANFVHGLPQYAVSVAVAVDDQVEFGVILDPNKGDTFRAARGAGSWWNGRPCKVSDRQGLDGAMLATGFPFRARHLLEPYLAIFHDVFLRCKAIRRPGAAALDLAYTACGIFDGFFEFRLSPWDVAAGSLLVEEAGGVVSDMSGGPDFLDNGDVLCGSPGVHQELLEVVGRHRDEWSECSGRSR
jgi:myo-inositol-1(or 4)-monophosphatase